MRTFTDSAGRTWTVALTIDAVKRVKALLGVNLLELEAGDPPLLTRLGTDIVLLCDVVFCLVKPQADAQTVSDEQFGQALGGDVILAAQTAFYEELVDFFRKLGRTDVARAAQAQRRMIDATVKGIETRLEGIDVDREVEKILAESGQTPGESSTSSPGPSASTQAP